MDGRPNVWTYRRTLETHFIRLAQKSQLNDWMKVKNDSFADPTLSSHRVIVADVSTDWSGRISLARTVTMFVHHNCTCNWPRILWFLLGLLHLALDASLHRNHWLTNGIIKEKYSSSSSRVSNSTGHDHVLSRWVVLTTPMTVAFPKTLWKACLTGATLLSFVDVTTILMLPPESKQIVTRKYNNNKDAIAIHNYKVK